MDPQDVVHWTDCCDLNQLAELAHKLNEFGVHEALHTGVDVRRVAHLPCVVSWSAKNAHYKELCTACGGCAAIVASRAPKINKYWSAPVNYWSAPVVQLER